MKKKLLALKPNVWYNLTNRSDRAKITVTIKELISERSKFILSDDEGKFMKLSTDLFDNTDQPGYEVKERDIGNGKKAQDLYCQGKLIAIR